MLGTRKRAQVVCDKTSKKMYPSYNSVIYYFNLGYCTKDIFLYNVNSDKNRNSLNMSIRNVHHIYTLIT